ncbi:ISL3-like element IS1096 family transposase [Isoptericola chiayiensis]|uniref:ISL3-like element IS1096 family transposase n=2 Tax=Isoptericola chiayiensis TaxID=579446 RepID=A0ABP8Y3L2_9MICO|nr:ISL3 family transposase [Isoptericola chiayiensis]NOV99544.1 transposase [Isoptericola chiayiensis]
MTVTVSSSWQLQGCADCGVVAPSRGRRRRVLHDVSHGEVPVRLVWRQRMWRCPEAACPRGAFVEQIPVRVAPRGSITGRAMGWAIGQLRREHATIAGLARRLDVSWWALWRAVKPELERRATDESRFAGVTSLGVDEHVWHHANPKTRGPKELTGMVDLTRDDQGRVHARLLDLVPGRSKKAYADWLTARGQEFRTGVQVAALDPFGGYKSAIVDQLEDATAVLDAFHVVKLGTQVVDEVRRRVQQDTTGHRGRKGDPLLGIQTILRAGAENLADKQQARLARAIEADERHEEVFVAWQCAQQLRAAYRQQDLTDGRHLAEKILASFRRCPIPEVARLGRTLRRWREAFLAYFATGRANNGPTEAMNGIIELHRRLARDYRNRENYRLRMLLAARGLTP